MKTLNPNIWPYVLRLFIAVGIIAGVCMALSGCSSTKQLEKAKQRVLTDASAFDQVGRKWNELNPCVNDSTTEFKAGGIDSAAMQEYYDWINGKFYDVDSTRFSDLVYRPKSNNEIKVQTLPYIVDGSAIQLYPEVEIRNAYKAGYKQGVKDFVKKYPPRLPDTLKTSVKDKQHIKLLEGDIAKLTQGNARLQGVIQVKDETIAAGKKSERSLMWWLIGAIAALVLSNGLWVYSKFKIPKLPKL